MRCRLLSPCAYARRARAPPPALALEDELGSATPDAGRAVAEPVAWAAQAEAAPGVEEPVCMNTLVAVPPDGVEASAWSAGEAFDLTQQLEAVLGEEAVPGDPAGVAVAPGPCSRLQRNKASKQRKAVQAPNGSDLREVGQGLWDWLGWRGAERPVLLPPPVYVKGHLVHPTHLQVWSRGEFHFCGCCGSWALQRPLALLEPCDAYGHEHPRLKVSQRDALSLVRRGLPPKRGAHGWGDVQQELKVEA